MACSDKVRLENVEDEAVGRLGTTLWRTQKEEHQLMVERMGWSILRYGWGERRTPRKRI
jgi:hypothetical protein